MPRNRINGHSNGQAASEVQTAPAAAQNGHETSNGTGNGHAAEQQPATNGSPSKQNPNSTTGETFSDPIREAECLKDVLRSVLARTSRLVKALRRQKKQARLVQTTLDSLRQLQNVS